MTAQRQPWPEQLAGTPAVAVIERAIEKRRLSHSLLLAGGDTAVLGAVAAAIADRLLNGAGSAAAFPVSGHPDAHELRPAKKMRQISAEATRDLITELQKTPAVAPRKVAIIHECDRMHVAAANIFLKTLEEPPANTTLLLTTARPHALLPTIRSRCLLFRFPAPDTTPPPNGWDAWLADYREWLGQLAAGVSGKTGAADALMTLYGLLARF
ncbi:MAG: DNA polymerase III subunit gamma/tau, partial [Opitutaceae bacterium]|nr:DNA polymerase III subunit gamma/tau [Opitutaceae bacterium]